MIGILTGLIGGVIMAIYTYLFMAFIAPELLDAIKDQAMANVGDMDPDQEDAVNSMMGIFTSPGFISLMVVIAKFFLGLIVGFFAGLVMKEEKPEALFSE